MTDKTAVLDINPWDTSDEQAVNRPKVVDFTTRISKMQQSNDNFGGIFKILAGVLIFLWIVIIPSR